MEHLLEKFSGYRQYLSVAVLIFVCVQFLSGCAEMKPRPQEEPCLLKPLAFSDYPLFSDDMLFDGLEHGIQKSLSYLNRIPADQKFVFGKDHYNTEHMIHSLNFFLKFIQTKPDANTLNQFIRTNYLIYTPIKKNKKISVLFTGYYEPFLKGSRTPNTTYRYPLYARPPDLITIDLSLFHQKYKGQRINGRYNGSTIIPYYDRKEIDDMGLLKQKAPVLAWLKDPVDAFFLQIQGSGKIFLDTGEILNVHYHASNGRPYRSIGRLLINNGKIPKSEMSMQRIRAYLNNHPDEIEDILYYNPSYVFFKQEREGPLGCIDVKLTPGRSLAVDRQLFPMASLAFIKTQKPLVDGLGKIVSWSDFKRFVLVQDTGGAIKGASRADLFWGNGKYAEIAAGHMQHRGNLFFLILKPNIS